MESAKIERDNLIKKLEEAAQEREGMQTETNLKELAFSHVGEKIDTITKK